MNMSITNVKVNLIQTQTSNVKNKLQVQNSASPVLSASYTESAIEIA